MSRLSTVFGCCLPSSVVIPITGCQSLVVRWRDPRLAHLVASVTGRRPGLPDLIPMSLRGARRGSGAGGIVFRFALIDLRPGNKFAGCLRSGGERASRTPNAGH